MQVLYTRCCGLDVHKETVAACFRIVVNGKVVKEVRTFATTTADLISLSGWLAENKCTHIAMEATGVYWKPVWHILSDGDFELVLANAAQVKNLPGRKTDVKDADWISDLLAHGLIRPSFVPDGPTQDMRTLLRTRKQLSREKASHILRIQKTLEDANIKLDSVVTDIMGLSGRKMIEAMIAGQTDPAKLARLADPRVKASQETLREALRGRVTRHHRFLLRLHLQQIDALDDAIVKIDREVEAGMAPFREQNLPEADIGRIRSINSSARTGNEGGLATPSAVCGSSCKKSGRPVDQPIGRHCADRVGRDYVETTNRSLDQIALDAKRHCLAQQPSHR